MRAKLTLALCRESEDFERAMVERLVEQAYETIREAVGTASEEIRARLGNEGRHLMNTIEEGYFQAIEVAARNGLGCKVVPRGDIIRDQRASIPFAMVPPTVAPVAPAPSAGPDQVINIRPCN